MERSEQELRRCLWGWRVGELDEAVGVGADDCPCVETGKPEIHLKICRDAECDLEQLDRLSHTDVSTKEGSVDLSIYDGSC